MQHILVAATDTMTRGPLRRLQELATRAARKSGAGCGRWLRGIRLRLQAMKEADLAAGSSECTPQRTMPRGPLITIEPMTMRPARIATRPDLARHRRASA
jgi:hypothetical protein